MLHTLLADPGGAVTVLPLSHELDVAITISHDVIGEFFMVLL
jgi:hypothetical protein